MQDLRSAVVGGVLVLLGVALGAVLFRSEPVGAQTSGYRACVFGRQETLDINNEGRWEQDDRNFEGNRIIRIPRGWEVVSAGGGATQQEPVNGLILICRR